MSKHHEHEDEKPKEPIKPPVPPSDDDDDDIKPDSGPGREAVVVPDPGKKKA